MTSAKAQLAMASRGTTTLAVTKSGPDDESRKQAVTLSLHPNPASGPVRVSWQAKKGAVESSEPYRLMIYDLLGVAVAQQVLPEGAGGVQSIVLPTLPDGVYFCLLRAGGQTIATQRLVVKR